MYSSITPTDEMLLSIYFSKRGKLLFRGPKGYHTDRLSSNIPSPSILIHTHRFVLFCLSFFRYLNAIQTVCPHILRYLTTAVIINKRRRNVLKDLGIETYRYIHLSIPSIQSIHSTLTHLILFLLPLLPLHASYIVKVIQQECYTYRDPITEFLEALYVNFDFEDAQVKLRECEKVLVNDFFLVSCRDEFIENARLFIFETYCRIHQIIDIKYVSSIFYLLSPISVSHLIIHPSFLFPLLLPIRMLAEKLNMDQEAAERWIVNLIRNARLDAKIDSQANTVIMGSQYPTVYQKVIEKTKGLSFRSYVLANNLAKTEVGTQRYGVVSSFLPSIL